MVNKKNILYKILASGKECGESREENREWVLEKAPLVQGHVYKILEIPRDSIPWEEAVNRVISEIWDEPNDIGYWLREVNI